MNVTLNPVSPKGTLSAIASKSAAHRLLICAAFAPTPTKIRCEQINEDMEATARCLRALGATVVRESPFYLVNPIQEIPKQATFPCGESGSTLRFFVPIVAALGVSASFEMEGRLPLRPLSPLREELEAHGISFSPAGSNPLLMEGRLTERALTIPGNISSQFISGLLFALCLCRDGGRLCVTGKAESLPYIDMTIDALSAFGGSIACTEETAGRIYTVHPRKGETPSTAQVEGDWSNAAFPLSAAAISGSVTIRGLHLHSKQGDRAILDLLEGFGAQVTREESRVTVSHHQLRGMRIDASQIPDLVPVLATVASFADGKTEIVGASRLRIKESDRLVTVRQMLCALGADVTETEDGLIIYGKPTLMGGAVSAASDHRIAMSAAVASVGCSTPVTIFGAQAVAKSYPSFFEDMMQLGFSISSQTV